MYKLKPLPVDLQIELTGKYWVVTDPTGRWREFTESTVCLSTGKPYSEFIVWSDGAYQEKPLYVFKIPTNHHLWVQQIKGDWLITEYRYKAR